LQFGCTNIKTSARPYIYTSPDLAMTSRGFTLAEVLLSVALTASTLLGLVSLLAGALHSVSASTDITMTTQIARNLLSHIQSSDWQLGDDYVSEPRPDQFYYFDDQGMVLPDMNSIHTQYTARIRWQNGGASLPGALSHLQLDSPTNPFSRRFTIQIAAGPAKDLSFFDDPARRSEIHTVHSVHTSRMPVLTSVP
jgi:uncharacterized protein (TIGR02598 family)